MVKSLRVGTALTALGLIGVITACASPMNKVGSASFGGKVGSSAVGVATRAQMAVQSGDFVTAVPLAERAVEGSPQDAGFRALLGNAYFGAGRFASAEAAYRDALTIYPNQPQIVLKLALVSIAQGKRNEAIALLDSARGLLDPSDYGLALALAGQPGAAVTVLEQASRAVGADSRVRQNLALTHALQGDWTAARTVAAQDVPADQLNARIQQWMAFAKPVRASDQVASLTGITPAASDPGQPVRLALAPPTNRTAAAEPVAPVAEPAPVMVEEVAVAAPLQPVMEVAPPVMPAPVVTAAAAPAYEPVPIKATALAPSAPVVAAPAPVAKAPVIAAKPVASAPVGAAPPPVAKAPAKRAVTKAAPKPALSPRAASLSDAQPLLRKASFPRAVRGNSKAVVQLGAYVSRSFVGVAWNNIARKFPALRGYTPATARFNSPKGIVYRLSLQGFASDKDARELCMALKRAGGNCFVRTIAGDAPVRVASL